MQNITDRTIIDLALLIDPTALTVEDEEFSDDPGRPLDAAPGSCLLVGSPSHVRSGQASDTLAVTTNGASATLRWRVVTMARASRLVATPTHIARADGGDLHATPVHRHIGHHLAVPPVEGRVEGGEPWRAVVDVHEHVVELTVPGPEILDLVIGFAIVEPPRGDQPMTVTGHFRWHARITVE